MDTVQVITLTPNPAIDHTVTLEQLVPGAVHRAQAEQFEAGGKGIGVAAVLAALGLRVAAGGWLGDQNPQRFEQAFAERGIVDAMWRVPGRTRTNIKLIDSARLMLDCGGAVLRELLAALQPPPDFIKPNRAELEELVGQPLPTVADVSAAALRLHQGGIALVVVSLGGEGAVIACDGACWAATTPQVPVATTVGAGDALVAGTLAALIEGRPAREAAVFGMACAAARIQRIAPGLPPRAEIDVLAARIALQPV